VVLQFDISVYHLDVSSVITSDYWRAASLFANGFGQAEVRGRGQRVLPGASVSVTLAMEANPSAFVRLLARQVAETLRSIVRCLK
jgi:hypothetical protein